MDATLPSPLVLVVAPLLVMFIGWAANRPRVRLAWLPDVSEGSTSAGRSRSTAETSWVPFVNVERLGPRESSRSCLPRG